MTRIATLLSVVRGRPDATEATTVSTREALRRGASKGLRPLMRGSLHRWRLHRVSGLFFLGRATRLLSPGQLTVGKHCYIGDFSYLDCHSSGGVQLGDRVTLREFAWLQLTSNPDRPGGRVQIGSGTYIGPRVYLGAGADIVIGSGCQIGGNVSLIAEEHDHAGAGVDAVTRLGIVVGDRTWIGNNAVVLDGVRIGADAVIAAGAVVTHDVPDAHLAVGVPARVRPRNGPPS
jgi:acetyltransferase-like isoleucine patch superfamily enzyme